MSNQRDPLPLHDCGGSIVYAGTGELEHKYCEKCGAFTYNLDAEVPDGTNERANTKAWDDGEEQSPPHVELHFAHMVFESEEEADDWFDDADTEELEDAARALDLGDRDWDRNVLIDAVGQELSDACAAFNWKEKTC